MATTGILQAENVIFYHPLDSDLTEHTVNEVWSGTAASVAGKVGQANSAVTESAIAFGALSTLNIGTSNFINDPVNVAGLSATSVVGGYDNAHGIARAGVVSGSTITWGAEAIFRIGSPQNLGSERFTDNIRKLDSTHVIVGYGKATGPSGGFVKIGTVNGLNLTWGPEQQFSVNAMTGDLVTEVMDSTHAVVFYREGSVTGHAKATVCVISGTSVTFGVESTFSTVNGHTAVINLSIAALSPTIVLAAAVDGNSFRVGTRSGSSMTWGVSTSFTMGTNARITLESLDSTTVVFGFYPPGAANVRVIKVSGDNVTFGASVVVPGAARGVDIAKLSSTNCVIAYRGSSDGRTIIATVTGLVITLPAFTVWNTADSVGTVVASLTGTSFIVGGWDFNGTGTARARIGNLNATAGISGTSANYPTAIGHDRVVMAMWARNLTSGSSTITIDRGYSITMTATSITLGGATATWNGTEIATLMSTMNNDSSHLLVLDFENTGGTNWILKTSVDGLAFTIQGPQTSGTQVIATTDTNPSLSIASGAGATQWIDELVMWCGDKTVFESFTTQQMANLTDLANVFGETMNNFDSNFGAPLCWQATARMPDGSAWRDSGSGPCPPVVRVPKGAEDVIITDDGHKVSPRIIEG